MIIIITEYTEQMMHNTIACHLLMDVHPIPEKQSQPPSQLPLVYILSVTSYGTEYPFGQFGSAVPAVSPPVFLCIPSLLAGRAV